METARITKFDKIVSILVHSRQIQPTDADGICAKYVIDAIVDAKILIDDSPKYVKEITCRPEKIKATQAEETIITIKIHER